MTMPALIAKYQKQLTINQLKTAYSILHETLNRAQTDNEDFNFWTYYQDSLGVEKSSIAFVNNYLMPYLEGAKIYIDPNIIGCNNITYRTMNRNTQPCSSVVGFCETCRASSNMPQIHLPNGMIIFVLIREYKHIITGDNYPRAEFIIDTNGLKYPNIYGKDIFRFSLTALGGKYGPNRNGVKLCGGDCHERSFDLLNQCTMDTAYSCAEVIIGDSWQIKDDYPWK